MINRARIPWLLTAGFALLFAGSILLKNQSDIKQPLIPVPPASTPRLATPQATTSGSPIKTDWDPRGQVLVARVIDGDTIQIEGNIRVRYIGIDTPEPGQCLGDIATTTNLNLILDKENYVTLERDIEGYDKYSRVLAYVFAGDIFINEKLVRDGLATVTTYPPNIKYVDKLLKAQQDAREARLGIWSDDPCPASNPPNPSDPSAPTSSNCLIKGNISSSGEKIYHIQGQRYYEKTKIEENKGERWFCTEEEARSAGWRKSKI